MPAPPRWLLAVPDAVRQLEKLDRDLLTRRDVEWLFGVSRARAAQLMPMFGAELVGAARVLRRTELLRQLRKYRARAAYRGEEQRRARLVSELRTARLTGILARWTNPRRQGVRASELLEVIALCVRQMNRLSFKRLYREDDGRTENVCPGRSTSTSHADRE